MIVGPEPVESLDAMPRYCPDCGRALVVEDRTTGFDRMTGAPRLTAYAECRGGLLERILSGEPHYRAVVAPRPSAGWDNE